MQIFTQAEKAEACNFHTVFQPDHTVLMGGPIPEAWTLLGALAIKTKTVKLCTAVSDTHRNHPAIMAQKVATLDQISNGRAMLGLGVGEAMNCDRLGIPRTPSMKKLREYIEVVRLLWRKRRVKYSGKYFQLKKGCIDIKPIKNHIPIYIAANGPKMCELTGEIGDGWLPAYMSPKLFAERRKYVENGIKKSEEPEKKLETFDFGLFTFTLISDDHQAIMKKLQYLKIAYCSIPNNINAAYNLDIPKDLHFALSEKEPDQDLMNKIPDRAIEELNIIGTVDECIAQIERFQKA
ncbi:MAG: LLM class flavin-dependent oxidoreductase, partial [Candidatus Hodarchaeota archaeon]